MVLALTLFNCSSDDDSASAPTVAELLTADTWYLESASSIIVDDCTKTTYFQFLDNGNVLSEGFTLNDVDGCITLGVVSGTYELISDTQLATTFNGETNESLIIVQITDEQLILRDESGSESNTLVFDKIQG
jgi:hypothetical protein